MRTEPMMAYYCENCGRRFTDAFECREHERKCKSTRTCPLCNGHGTIFCGYTAGRYVGFGCYEKVKDYQTCSVCGGRGWVHK